LGQVTGVRVAGSLERHMGLVVGSWRMDPGAVRRDRLDGSRRLRLGMLEDFAQHGFHSADLLGSGCESSEDVDEFLERNFFMVS
jgi:hypothetical protein